MKTKVYNIFLHFIFLIPFVLLIANVYKYFVNIYFWDTYSLISNINDKLSLKWLFALHNEHWIIPTKLIYYIQSQLFNGSKILIISIQIIIQLYIFYFIFFKIKKEIEYLDTFYKIILFVSISIFLTSLQLSGIWYWGFAIQQQFTLIFYILTINYYYKFISNNSTSCYVQSIVFAILSAFSSANGLISIFIIWIISIIFSTKKYKIYNFLILLILYSTYIMTYIHSPKVITTVKNISIMITIKNYILYFFSFFGSLFSIDNIKISSIIGFLGILTLMILCFIIYQKKLYSFKNSISYFLLILLLPLSSGLLAAIGRSKYGIEQSLDSRYIIFSSIFWIIILILLSLINNKFYFIINQIKFKILTSIVIIFFTTLYVNTLKQYNIYRGIQEDVKVQYQALQNGYYIYSPISVYTQLYPDPKIVYNFLNLLYKNEYHIFTYNTILGKNIKNIYNNITNLKIKHIAIEKIKCYIPPQNKQKIQFAYEFKGWIDINNNFYKNYIIATNHNNIIIGKGLLGYHRKDVSLYLNTKKTKYGFRGFINTCDDIKNIKFYIVGKNNALYKL